MSALTIARIAGGRRKRIRASEWEQDGTTGHADRGPAAGGGPLLAAGRAAQRQLGLIRSWCIYYGQPFRHRHLVNFYRGVVQAGDLCFDLGAHLGNHTRAWLALGASVVAVEPHPQCMGWLRRTYGDCPEVHLIERAIGQAATSDTLMVSRLHPTVSTTSEGWRDSVRRVDGFAQVRWPDRVPVEVTTLDKLLARYGEPKFCKIDVEGAELKALNGIRRPLRALSFEFVPAAIARAHGCVERLEQLGSYEYNWSVAEPPRLQGAEWVGPDGICRQLSSMAGGADSGDVYARLVSEATSS